MWDAQSHNLNIIKCISLSSSTDSKYNDQHSWYNTNNLPNAESPNLQKRKKLDTVCCKLITCSEYLFNHICSAVGKRCIYISFVQHIYFSFLAGWKQQLNSSSGPDLMESCLVPYYHQTGVLLEVPWLLFADSQQTTFNWLSTDFGAVLLN